MMIVSSLGQTFYVVFGNSFCEALARLIYPEEEDLKTALRMILPSVRLEEPKLPIIFLLTPHHMKPLEDILKTLNHLNSSSPLSDWPVHVSYRQ
jgi:hypothetical protein